MVSPKCCPRGRRPGTHRSRKLHLITPRHARRRATPPPRAGARGTARGALYAKGMVGKAKGALSVRSTVYVSPLQPSPDTRQPGRCRGTETTRILHQRSSTITLHELTPRKSTVCTHAGGPRACFWPRVHITSCAHQISERAMNPLPSKYEWPSISGSKAASAGRNFANASEPLCTFA